MTRDPSTNSVPSERVLDAIKLRDAKLNSRSYLNRQTEINWTERGPSKQAGRTRALMLDGNFSSNFNYKKFPFDDVKIAEKYLQKK